MSCKELSEWRATQKKRRKAFNQQMYRQRLKIDPKSIDSKFSRKFFPPDEILSKMDSKALSEWRADQRRERKNESQREKRAKAAAASSSPNRPFHNPPGTS